MQERDGFIRAGQKGRQRFREPAVVKPHIVRHCENFLRKGAFVVTGSPKLGQTFKRIEAVDLARGQAGNVGIARCDTEFRIRPLAGALARLMLLAIAGHYRASWPSASFFDEIARFQ